MSKERDPRDWSDDDDVNLLLVRAPITFGHTQLVMQHEKNPPRQASFEEAGPHIDRAIEAMHACLTETLMADFPVLGEITDSVVADSVVALKKVLVLRASASESVDKQLKIHLVPYFQSHHDACVKRFAQRHRALPGAPGGLLGWLGEQEDRADKWEVDHPREDQLNDWASETLGLTKLAERLHKSLTEETASQKEKES